MLKQNLDDEFMDDISHNATSNSDGDDTDSDDESKPEMMDKPDGILSGEEGDDNDDRPSVMCMSNSTVRRDQFTFTAKPR